MGKLYSIPNTSPTHRDTHEPDRIFWGRFENICNIMHKAFPDMKAIRRGDDWTIDAPSHEALEAFEELALMFCKRMKVPGKMTRSDCVQYFLRSMVAMQKTGDAAFSRIMKNPELNG